MGFFSSTSEAVSRPAGSTAPAASGNSRRNREVSAGLSIIAKDLTIAGDLQAAGVIRATRKLSRSGAGLQAARRSTAPACNARRRSITRSRGFRSPMPIA